MPVMSQARSSNGSKTWFSSSYSPVAVFVGGTSGIGRTMAEAFARYTQGHAHIILIGRNKVAADKTIASFPSPSDPTIKPKYEFFSCDASLMSNVHDTAKFLLVRIPKINFLILTAGYEQLVQGRVETADGIDRKLALMYYSRWLFIRDLLPLLHSASAQGEDARVLSVLAAGYGSQIDLEDMGLKKHFGAIKAMRVAPTYTDLAMEEFSRRHPNITFTHAFPGVVLTNIYTPDSWVVRPFALIFSLFLYPVSIPVRDCAEYMWWALLDSKQGGFSMRGKKGDLVVGKRYYGGQGEDHGRKVVWGHTEGIIDRAVGGD